MQFASALHREELEFAKLMVNDIKSPGVLIHGAAKVYANVCTKCHILIETINLQVHMVITCTTMNIVTDSLNEKENQDVLKC